MNQPPYVEGDEHRDLLWLPVRRVLMTSWDPIGVSDDPQAADEYDLYIPKIKSLLRQRSGVEVVLDYLDWVATERMDLRDSAKGRGPLPKLFAS